MNYSLLRNLLLLLLLLCVIHSIKSNFSPIIGIITQDTDEHPNSQIMNAGNVKLMEASGARVVPIFIYQDRMYYERIFNSTNAVLFPRSKLDPVPGFNKTGYVKSAKIMFELAVDANTHVIIIQFGQHLWKKSKIFKVGNYFLYSNFSNHFPKTKTKEAKKYPFYGVQFHPEFPVFEYLKKVKGIAYTAESI
ncbi:gamma-glutamyl hydrolase-like protein [Leptotrombidium deliense]|uniref:Gamma-glutamyl hydrolase-like protein n=1 Tax=Leptotrombidium deliense TaxID=299467 RepID=A0A443RY79_9ACAR|nr:gamma-glutamyl hydrolase-like protein [Leptotrombidium deliense]